MVVNDILTQFILSRRNNLILYTYYISLDFSYLGIGSVQ